MTEFDTQIIDGKRVNTVVGGECWLCADHPATESHTTHISRTLTLHIGVCSDCMVMIDER